MQSHNKEVVKDISSGPQLENELQISEAQHGVAVLDVYNAEWGNTKALNETFRRLYTDAGDLVHLRFFSVECNLVLESLKNPQSSAVSRPKTARSYHPDTLASRWSSVLESRCQHSKPFFVFYKEGKMMGTIEGINTPKITKYINDLCKQQNPITDYITNADLLRFWKTHFSEYDSEVTLSAFEAALRKEGYEVDSATLELIYSALDTKSSRGKVLASSVQSWVGDESTLRSRIQSLNTSSRQPPQTVSGSGDRVVVQDAEEVDLTPSPKERKSINVTMVSSDGNVTVCRVDGSVITGHSSLDTRMNSVNAEMYESRSASTDMEFGEASKYGDMVKNQNGAGSGNNDQWRELDDNGDSKVRVGDAPEQNLYPSPTASDKRGSIHAALNDEEGQRGSVSAAAVEGQQSEESNADKWRELGEGSSSNVANNANVEDLAEQNLNPSPTANDKRGSLYAALSQEEQRASISAAAVEGQQTEESNADKWRELGEGSSSNVANNANVEDLAEQNLNPSPTANDKRGSLYAALSQEEQRASISAAAVEGQQTVEGAEEKTGDQWRELGEEETTTTTTTTQVTETKTIQVRRERKSINQVFIHDGWVTVSEREMDLWNTISDLPLHYPEQGAIMLRSAADAPSVEVPPKDFTPLDVHMVEEGVHREDVDIMCLAADQKIGSESLSIGKLSLILTTGEKSDVKELVPSGERLYEALSSGTLLHQFPHYAYTAMCLCSSDAYPDEAFNYVLSPQEKAVVDNCKEGDEMVLAALSPLQSNDVGAGSVRVVGLPKVIELATTDEADGTVVLSQWYAKLKVIEVDEENGVTLQFKENVIASEFDAFVEAYTNRLIESEGKLDKKESEVEKDEQEEDGSEDNEDDDDDDNDGEEEDEHDEL